MAEEDSNAWVGITIFASMLPFFLVPPFAGLLADRMVRRNLVAWALAVNLAQGVALAVLALSGDIQMWQLVLFSFVNGSARAVQMTATQSLVANLVPRENLLNGYALTTATRYGSRLLGPGVIAPMMAVIEPGWIFFFCSIYYLAGLYLVLRIHTKSTGVVEPARGVLYNLLAGLRYTYTHSTLSVIVVLVLFHCGLTMSFESLLPVISDERFASGGSGMAYLMMAGGGGALMASLFLAGIRGERARGQLLLITAVLSGLTPLALAGAPNLLLGMLATASMGASQMGFMVISLTMMQAIAPDAIRGRISSIYAIHAGGFMAFANLGNGFLADIFDPAWLLTVGGLAFLVVTAVSMVGPATRRVYLVRAPAQVAAV